LRWGALIALVATLGAVWRLTARPETLLEAAKTSYECLYRADGHCLMRFVWKEEVEANRLDPEKLSMILRTIVKPALDKYGDAPAAPQYLISERQYGEASTDLKTKSGHLVQWVVVTTRIDGSPKTSLSDIVCGAWKLRYMAERDRPFEPKTLIESFVEGYQRDKPFLDSIGFRCLVRADEETGSFRRRSLEDVLARAEQSLQARAGL
jgi:hypothetical protein